MDQQREVRGLSTDGPPANNKLKDIQQLQKLKGVNSEVQTNDKQQYYK